MAQPQQQGGGDQFWTRLWQGALKPAYARVRRWLDAWRERFPGPFYSFWLHLLLFVMILGVPYSCQKPPAPLRVITVDLLPVTDKTNVPQKEEPPAPEEKKEQKPEQKEEKKAPPSAPEQKEEEKKPEPAPVPVKKPEPKKKEEKKKEEKKKPEPKKDDKKKDKAKDFDSLLKSIEEEAKKSDSKDKKKAADDTPKAKTPTDFNPELPLSVSEIDAIIGQISKCWSIPAGAKGIQDIAVLLRVSLREDGSVIRVDVVERSRYNDPGEPVYRAAADSARRAVLKCSPLKGLPREKYGSWKEIEINFDPREMIY